MLRMIILLIAIGSGGVAAWISMTMTAAPPAPVISQVDPTADILVAANALSPGAALGVTDMHWQSWPADRLVDGFVVRSNQPNAMNQYTGYLTRNPLAVGEPIRAESLLQSEGGFMAVMLDPGLRAVAVRVSAESTAGGFILPNDRVDVLRTQSVQGPTGQTQMQSETILRNIRVLAIDQTTDTRMDGSVLGKTATLELQSAEVEIVVAAEASGLLSLSLRSYADNADGPRIVAAPAPAPTVRILRGGVVQESELR